jgi:hypothetical protein
MKKVVILAMSLSFAASMALAQAAAVPTTKEAALQQLQTVAPGTTVVGGVSVTALSLGALLVAIAAIAAGGNGGGSSSSSSSSSSN